MPINGYFREIANPAGQAFLAKADPCGARDIAARCASVLAGSGVGTAPRMSAGGLRLRDSRPQAASNRTGPRRVILSVLRVRYSSDRSGNPIVAGERTDSYAINYPAVQ